MEAIWHSLSLSKASLKLTPQRFNFIPSPETRNNPHKNFICMRLDTKSNNFPMKLTFFFELYNAHLMRVAWGFCGEKNILWYLNMIVGIMTYKNSAAVSGHIECVDVGDMNCHNQNSKAQRRRSEKVLGTHNLQICLSHFSWGNIFLLRRESEQKISKLFAPPSPGS